MGADGRTYTKPFQEVHYGLVGKYVKLHDAYLSGGGSNEPCRL